MSETPQEIEFTIAPDGRLEYTIKGIKGGACEDVSKLFEEIGSVTAESKTGEFYEKDAPIKQNIKGKV